MHPSFSSTCSLSVACLVCVLVSGCSISTTSAPTADAGLAIQGKVFGGQQPIVGAQVYLFAANAGVFTPNANGYGNASVSLLTSGTGRTLDNSGGPTNGDYYVTTLTGGAFSITGDYTCTANTQVYLYALSGNPGSGGFADNPSSGLLAALGNCPSGGTFSSSLYVVVNEVSTAGTAYAIAGFATDATHVSSSGTALAKTGIGNAFANVANLAGISTGTALATTPGGGGTVPQSEINTLGNILAACVNSNGVVTGPTNPTACYTLFTNALSGGTTGTQPTDTATAAINMAHYPGANIAALYGLSTANPQFAPALSAQPNDFTVAISFTGGGINTPSSIAIDGSGDAWIANNGSTASVTELSPLGAALNSSPLTGGGLATPHGIAIDLNGNAWVANYAVSGSITELNGITGAVGSTFSGGGLNEPVAIAVDGSDNIWTANYGESIMGNVSKFANNGTADSGSNGYGTDMEINTGIAIDPGGNAWSSDLNYGNLDEVNNTGTLESGFAGYNGGSSINNPTALAFDSSSHVWVATHGSNVRVLSDTGTAVGTYTGGGLGLSQAIAIDGAGNAWIENTKASLTTPGLLSEFTNGGTAITASTGYTSSTLISNTTPIGIAIDGSGDLWVTNNGNSSVTEFIGAGVPVVTPLAVGVKNSTLGTRP
jgi:hypothetical protein